MYRPAALQANFNGTTLLPNIRFHSLRHTYASLCIAPFTLSKFMGHANMNVTLGVYAHFFEDDYTDAMSAVRAVGRQFNDPANVVPMRAG